MGVAMVGVVVSCRGVLALLSLHAVDGKKALLGSGTAMVDGSRVR